MKGGSRNTPESGPPLRMKCLPLRGDLRLRCCGQLRPSLFRHRFAPSDGHNLWEDHGDDHSEFSHDGSTIRVWVSLLAPLGPESLSHRMCFEVLPELVDLSGNDVGKVTWELNRIGCLVRACSILAKLTVSLFGGQPFLRGSGWFRFPLTQR